jgi:hypothetical protein
MPLKEKNHKYAHKDEEESPEESTVMSKKRHAIGDDNDNDGDNGKPAPTMVTPPTWRTTPSETSTGVTTTTMTRATMTVMISSPMIHSISYSISINSKSN